MRLEQGKEICSLTVSKPSNKISPESYESSASLVRGIVGNRYNRNNIRPDHTKTKFKSSRPFSQGTRPIYIKVGSKQNKNEHVRSLSQMCLYIKIKKNKRPKGAVSGMILQI